MSGQLWAAEMAIYNQWQDDKLLGLCEALGEDGRREERGMFFGCIHRTLDHILMVDRVLLDFALSLTPPDRFEPDIEVIADFAQLADEQREFDADLRRRLESAPDTWFLETASFYSNDRQRDRHLPRFFMFSQLFNHATHHRSQVTSELHRLGIDYGNTDLPYNPHSSL